MPLVHRLVHVAGLEVHVTKMHRHGVWRDPRAIDVGHHFRDLWADAQIP